MEMVIAALCAGLSIGMSVALWSRIFTAEAALKQKVTEFSDIMAKASEANLSLGKKVLAFEERLQVLEFRYTSSNIHKK